MTCCLHLNTLSVIIDVVIDGIFFKNTVLFLVSYFIGSNYVM